MWSPMTVDEFAESESANGAEITQVDGFYWRKIRPFFIAPCCPYQKYNNTDRAVAIQKEYTQLGESLYEVMQAWGEKQSELELMVVEEG